MLIGVQVINGIAIMETMLLHIGPTLIPTSHLLPILTWLTLHLFTTPRLCCGEAIRSLFQLVVLLIHVDPLRQEEAKLAMVALVVVQVNICLVDLVAPVDISLVDLVVLVDISQVA